MKLFNTPIWILLCIFLAASCHKTDEPAALSSDNSIYDFTALDSENDYMLVTVSNSNHTIKIAPTCNMNIQAIRIKVTAFEKAVCSLPKDTVLDLLNTQKFTITAEDGTAQTYSIFVQGCMLKDSYFYKDCDVYRSIDCLTQENTLPIFDLPSRKMLLSFNELPNYGTDDDIRVGFELSDTDFLNTGFENFEINPIAGQDSKAYFIYKSSTFGYLNNPQGTLVVGRVDTENHLISGYFAFYQGSASTCSSHSDLIAGDFYGVPY